MTPVEFELTISGGERPKTYSLDRTATWTGVTQVYNLKFTVVITLIIIIYYDF
jgi:hypothetical protein